MDEDLISAVQKRRALYDYRIPLKERGRQKKDDLWKDVSQYLKGKIYINYKYVCIHICLYIFMYIDNKNCVSGLYTPIEAEKRWNYLKDCYRKARNTLKKKQNIEQRSGAAAKPKNEGNKPAFRYYYAMNFLSDVLEHRQ